MWHWQRRDVGDGLLPLVTEGVHDHSGSRHEPDDHVAAAVSHHYPHGVKQGVEGVDAQDVGHAHEGHHTGVNVDLTVCHHHPGKTLCDATKARNSMR